MTILDPLYRYGNATAWEKDALVPRANAEDARLLNRLAEKAVALANEYGVALSYKDALLRVRGNLAFVRGMAADTGVGESGWLA